MTQYQGGFFVISVGSISSDCILENNDDTE